MALIKTGVVITVDRVRELEGALADLADRRLLVGVPKETDRRDGEQIDNAALAYIHDNGAPDANVPPRPFMEPGIRAAFPAITAGLVEAARIALTEKGIEKFDKRLGVLGFLVVASIKRTIRANIPPPLAESTVRARIARRKSPTWRAKRSAAVDANIAAGLSPQTGLFTALIDTGSMLNAITWVIRKRRSDRSIVVGPTRR